MKGILVLFTCALFAFSRAEAAPPTLWASTQFGMTTEQVLKVVPGAETYGPNPGDRLAGGAVELVRGPMQTIVSHQFVPHFYFADNKLQQVTLSLNDVKSSYEAQLVFDSLMDALRTKYGAEISARKTTLGQEATWRSGQTNITMALMAVDGMNPILNVVYQTRIATDASHL